MRPLRPLLAAFAAALFALPALADAPATLTPVKPQYLTPAELARILNVHENGGRDVIEWRSPEGVHVVEVRRSDAANQILLSGAADDVAAVQAVIRASDLAPRQIAIEARIVEVDQSKARDLGIDWSHVYGSIDAIQRVDWMSQRAIQRQDNNNGGPSGDSPGFFKSDSRQRNRLGTIDETSRLSLSNALTLFDENGGATYRDAPRILTLNNHRATILDGQHVTYVTRYSAATNLFATDSMEAGLRLSVLPSLGESGYLTLDLRAELTSLSGNISGSPVKDGQVVENTVMVKDGESVMLGGFTRTVNSVTHRRFPVLGSVLPFLFSRDVTQQSQRQTFFVVTPHVVDLTGGLDPATKGAVEGH